MFIKSLIIASLIGAASAACPNQCSGHGTCGANEVCTCYDNWGMGGQAGGDCSDRICPYELAWVDAPDRTGKTHSYAECAAKGICDRETGQCACLPGYDGKACGRQTCPDDCSNHGTCEYMNELTFATVFNDYYNTATAGKLGVGGVRPATDFNWDASRARACVCDSNWSGINCATRMCPYGNDAMATRADTSDALQYQTQKIVIYSGGLDGQGNNTSSSSVVDFEDNTFALTFTSAVNETFTTIPILVKPSVDNWETTLAASVTSALRSLPNQVIDDVTVTVTQMGNELGVGFSVNVVFNGDAVHGRQNLLEVSANPCADGCTPQITGFPLMITGSNTTSYVVESVAADFNSYECGRRGKCDGDTGICSCFEGFTGASCTTITALV